MQFDDEIVQTFVQEAQDLLKEITDHFDKWHVLQENECATAILRDLHTLKGSARMMGYVALSAYIHRFEQVIQKFATEGSLNAKVVAEVQYTIDVISETVEKIVQHQDIEHIQFPLERFDTFLDMAVETESELIETTIAPDPSPEKEADSSTQEYIRVRGDLIENLSTLSGLVNINRSNVEQQLFGAREIFADMSRETKQVQEHMRHLQLKTDANLRMVQNMYPGVSEEFDVLEMDRYSFLQQSTREIIDKLNTLEELNSFLSNAFHGLELVVMDQGKATRHLEEQIMRARMVPIDVLVDRLKRIIRQVSRELDKDVDFNVKAFGEADRKTLEKLTPALEHMVRNAIDHGIESPEVRKALGKPEKGQIKLVVYRQGNEIIIELSDDGQGIDVEKVLAKAVERDIWPKTQTMRKEDVLRIISLSGFSTRDEVTPISGRGVGMDVVMQEIQDLGGQLQVETKVNHGTRFTIRLPFSLALNQALIFTSGEQDYAILLTNITAISRLSQETLNIQFALEQHLIEYSGEAYQLVYLAELFQNKHWQNADKQQSYPVVFIHANENRVAFVIDKIIGSREVVIKPIGYQFETVKAFAGVSLLGDGRTVLVLNAPHLVQMTRQTTDSSMEGPVAHQKRITVLITDDSITVRQVTSRFLRRHQYIPMQAKDGLEALNAMAKSKPDVVLLDIEMPRMDGFEVIQKMRATPELHDIPIIVITSRALEKHRQRAMKLGANAYITKPFQENDLLELLQKLQPND